MKQRTASAQEAGATGCTTQHLLSEAARSSRARACGPGKAGTGGRTTTASPPPRLSRMRAAFVAPANAGSPDSSASNSTTDPASARLMRLKRFSPNGRRSEALSQLGPEVLGDREPHVQPHLVGELERSHRVPVAELDGAVDLLRRRDALLEHPDRLHGERDAEPAGGKPRRIAHHHHFLPEPG